MHKISAMMRWLRLGGIYRGDDEWLPGLVLKRSICMLFMLEAIVPMAIYLYTTELDLFDISATLYSLFMFIGMSVQYVIFVCRSGPLRRLIDDVTAWTRRQRERNGHQIFQHVDRRVNRNFRIFETFTIFSYLVYIAVPAFTQFQAWRRGEVDEQTYAASFHDLYYFFETTETPLYEIFYVAFALGVFAMMTSYFAKGFLFITFCFYLVALYGDLKWLLVRVDQRKGKAVGDVQQRQRLMKECVRVHNQIYRFTDRANEIMGVVIFIQLVYSLSTLTMLVFSLTFLDVAEMSVPLINSGCLVGELFLFCWTGSLVLDEADKVNRCVYNLQWYDFTVSELRCLLPILQRNLRPVGLSAVGYFSCNLVTFHWIITKVFSAFTFMQSLE